MGAIVPYDHQLRLAEAFASSGLFGIKSAAQALTLMAISEAEGLHPAIAARDYHIINGKPALKADAMLARFQANGGKVRWEEMTDARVAAIFSHPSGGEVLIDWDMARARTAGFAGKENWRKFPRQMLRARVISEGIRTVFPGVAVGAYTPEEVQDFDTREPAREIASGVADPVDADWRDAADNQPETPPRPKAQSRAPYARFQREIDRADSVEALHAWRESNLADIQALPDDWRAALKERFLARMSFLGNAPAVESENPAAGAAAEDIRSPDEILTELENVVSGVMDVGELADVEREYLALPGLAFPGDGARARAIIKAQAERIAAQ